MKEGSSQIQPVELRPNLDMLDSASMVVLMSNICVICNISFRSLAIHNVNLVTLVAKACFCELYQVVKNQIFFQRNHSINSIHIEDLTLLIRFSIFLRSRV